MWCTVLRRTRVTAERPSWVMNPGDSGHSQGSRGTCLVQVLTTVPESPHSLRELQHPGARGMGWNSSPPCVPSSAYCGLIWSLVDLMGKVSDHTWRGYLHSAEGSPASSVRPGANHLTLSATVQRLPEPRCCRNHGLWFTMVSV